MAMLWLSLVLPAAGQLVHEWTRQRGGADQEWATGLQVDGAGKAWVAGNTYSALDGNENAGKYDIFVMTFDGDGNHLWTQQRGGARSDYANALQVDATGKAWVAGSTFSSLDGNTNAGGDDVFLMTFDRDGNHLWTRQRGGWSMDRALDLQVDASGRAWVAGRTSNSLDGHTNAGGEDIFLMTFDGDGNHLWTRQRGGPGADGARALQVDATGKAWVVGYTYSALEGRHRPSRADIFVMTFDGDGNHLWTRQRGGSDYDWAEALYVDATGKAWVAGYTLNGLDGNENAGSDDIFLMTFDGNGNHLWTSQRGGVGADRAYALQVDATGTAWVAGRTESSLGGHENAGQSDIFLMAFSAEGTHLWTHQRGGAEWDEAKALQVDDGGKVWMAGRAGGSLDGQRGAGSSDVFLMRFSVDCSHASCPAGNLRSSSQLSSGFSACCARRGSSSSTASTTSRPSSTTRSFTSTWPTTTASQTSSATSTASSTTRSFTSTWPTTTASQTSSATSSASSTTRSFTSTWPTTTASQTSSATSSASSTTGSFTSTWPTTTASQTSSATSSASSTTRSFTSTWPTTTASQTSSATSSASSTTGSFTSTWPTTTASQTSSATSSASSTTRSFTSTWPTTTASQTSSATSSASSTTRSLTSTWPTTTASETSSGSSTTTSSTSAEGPAPPKLPRPQSEADLQTSTTTGTIILQQEAQPWMPARLIELGSATDRPSNPQGPGGLLVAAIVAPLLMACLCVALGIALHRAKKLRKLQGGTPAVAEVPPTRSPPAVLRSTPLKPLLFSWDSRMTAEWPRGKVQKLTVGEDGFDLGGRQYQFQQGQVRQFAWEDGTIQSVQSIQKNVVWWRTQHRKPAWQQFRWICTPKCRAAKSESAHDMELADSASDGYRCASCSRVQSSPQHWCCPRHQVHVCPACAELPPEGPTLGVSATFLVDIFPDLAQRAASKEDPNFYEICPNLAHGTAGLGHSKTCPRDGLPHCSIVDAVDDVHSGQVTHFVSWCWAYSLKNVVSAVGRWLQNSGQDPRDVFLWMCFFCNNQYRIQDASRTGADDLREIFESHLVEAGHMLVLLDTIVQPVYVTRAWCIFESYVCIAQNIPMNIILPETAENFFRETMCSGRIHVLGDAISGLNVRYARAGSEKDEDLIKRIILTTIGFGPVNEAVRSRLLDQLTLLFRQLLTQPS